LLQILKTKIIQQLRVDYSNSVLSRDNNTPRWFLCLLRFAR